jgi:hypothetical protein
MVDEEQEGQQKPKNSKDKEDGPPERHWGPFKLVLLAAGSATSVASLLLFFGYLSHTSLLASAGLPMLSFDYMAMIEAGAAGVVESIGLGLRGGRTDLVLLLIGLALALWVLRDTRWIKRLALSPRMCLVVQLGLLLAAGALMTAQVGIAQLASAGRRPDQEARARRVAADYADAGLVEQHERIWETTYIPEGLAGQVLGALAMPEAGDLEGREGLSSYGQRLRPSIRAQWRAEDVFGWLVLIVLVFSAALVLMRHWRLWLKRQMAEQRGDERRGTEGPAPKARSARFKRLSAALRKRTPAPVRRVITKLQQRWQSRTTRLADWVPAERALAACAWITEPLALLVVMILLGLLPVAHGVLAQPGVGREAVFVRLKDSPDCRSSAKVVEAPKGSPETAAPAGPGAPPSPALGLATDPPPAVGADLEALLKRLPGEDEVKGPAPAGAPGACTQAQLDQIEPGLRKVASLMRKIIQTREAARVREQYLSDFKKALDEALDATYALNCLGAVQRLWQLRPHPALAARAPDVVDYFWVRWEERAAASLLRHGRLLTYPRGADGDRVSLLEAISERTPLQVGRWALQEVDRTCMDQVEVVPSAQFTAAGVVSEIQRIARDSEFTLNSDQSANIELYLQPEALEVVLDLLQRDRMLVSKVGPLITTLGTLAGAFAETHPDLARRAVAHLAETLRGEGRSATIRGTAATSLSLIRNLEAAEALADALDHIGWQEVEDELGTTITAAGFLAGDVRHGRDFDHHRHFRALMVHLRLVSFLVEISRTQTGSHRATACSSLSFSGAEVANTAIREALRLALQAEDALAAGRCITATGLTAAADRPGSQDDLWAVVQSSRDITLRGAALAALHLTGDQQVERWVEVFRQPPDEAVLATLAAFSNLDASRLGQRLLACAENEKERLVLRRRCMLGLVLTGDHEEGEELVSRLATLAQHRGLIGVSDLGEDARLILAVLQQRGAHAARTALLRLDEEADPKADEKAAQRLLMLLISENPALLRRLNSMMPGQQGD